MRHSFHLLLSSLEQVHLHTNYAVELDFYMSFNYQLMKLNAMLLACYLMSFEKSSPSFTLGCAILRLPTLMLIAAKRLKMYAASYKLLPSDVPRRQKKSRKSM